MQDKIETEIKILDPKKRLFIEALKARMGNITKASEDCLISRQTYYDWLNSDPSFKFHCENIGEYIIDIVEDSLLTQIKEGNTVATIFYLKTKGRNRGYIEKQEIKHSTDRENPINFNLNVTEDIGIKRQDNASAVSDTNNAQS